ncbi:MAG: ATP-binding protein [Candidatus Kaiserbacteria bacterium]|nr:ATP-binding protein [Candidatus Kaiserbacteria bacterium]
MDTKTREKIEVFLREQVANTGAVARQYIADTAGNYYPKRDIYKDISKYVYDFLQGNTAHPWCVITGLRGVGKTTVLMQIFSEITAKKVDTLFISVDRITELFGVSLADVLRVYEEMTGSVFEKREKQLVLFIDEAQYDKKWGITLKDVYDRAKHKVFIYTTGSAALQLKTDKDPTRRPVFIEMLPLTFTEYMKVKNQKPIDSEVQKQMHSALFESTHADEAYQKILTVENKIKKYQAGSTPLEVQNFIKEGSLPSTLFSQAKEVFDACDRTLARTIKEDIAEMHNFKASTVQKGSTMLYMLASTDQVSYESLGKSMLNLSRHTVKGLLDAFVTAGVLIQVPAYTASHNAQVRQKSKFLFAAPVFRSTMFNRGGSVLSPNMMYGKLLEDVVGTTLYRIVRRNDNSRNALTYDAKDGGADFVVDFSGKKIVIEVGAGSKDIRQIKKTAKRVDPAYSILIDDTTTVSLDTENNTIRMPLEYFLLL